MRLLIFLLLLMLPIFAAAQTFIGYGFWDNRDANVTLLGLGLNRFNQTIICFDQIAYSPNMSISGQIIKTSYITALYSGSTTPSFCFSNFTCELSYLNGSVYKTLNSTSQLSEFLNFTNVTPLVTYLATCRIFDTAGGNASTEGRQLLALGNVTEGVEGDLSMFGILVFFGILALVAWSATIYCIIKKRGFMAIFTTLLAALMITIAGLLIGMDSATQSSAPGTASLLSGIVGILATVMYPLFVLFILALFMWIYHIMRQAYLKRAEGKRRRGEI